MGFPVKFTLWSIIFLTLSACASLPRGAALQKDVLQSVNHGTDDFAVFPVTREVVAVVGAWPTPSPKRHGWLKASHGSVAQIIRPGDRLDAHVWDTGENALLTTTEQRTAQLPTLRVSERGTIFLPYVGNIKVSGRSPDSARALVQRKLEEVVPSVQVHLTMAEGRGNSIDLVTGVRRPGNISLPDQNFTVLAAISEGGGVAETLKNPQVKLLRGTKTYATSLHHLFDDPGLDARLRGGDKLLVEPDPRYFLALGAAGKEAQIPFNRDDISALDALALMGGIQDNRADPKGILVLRQYSPKDAQRVEGPGNTRVVFTIDLTTSDGLFSAGNFHIQSRDLVLATESPVTNTRTVLGLVGSVFGLVSAANSVSN